MGCFANPQKITSITVSEPGWYWAYLMASSGYLGVCLLCWWDAFIPPPSVSWTANPSSFVFRPVLLQGSFFVCSWTAGGRVHRAFFVLRQPLVCPRTYHCTWPMHTMTGLVLYFVNSLKLIIIFQLFLIWAAACHECFNCWDVCFVLLMVASVLLVPS